ncbi:hypothetical protein OIU77_023767 [Salix suchowensis]|uniref:ABC-2 type transporter transmembrane domain-containing protein n=1 Tax=Salix suchowensis TaxID=1278906 RepID=A0ABQ9C528_9ROSI|nr:hypothetical protein OIU77_023767 [Salix suchowensis]
MGRMFPNEASRFFKQLLLVFFIQQMASGLFRLIAGVCRTMIIANTGGALTLLLIFLARRCHSQIGGGWGYWVSPLSYGFNAIAGNEMSAPRWMNKPGTNTTITAGKSQAMITEETTKEETRSTQSLSHSDGNNTGEMAILRMNSRSNPDGLGGNADSFEAANGVAHKRGMVLPFTPLAMSFDSVNYFVDMPARGGQVIYSGPLGRNSHKIVEYFEAIPGVPKIKEKYNPATWMLEVSSVAAEVRLGMDFAEHHKASSLHQYVQ